MLDVVVGKLRVGSVTTDSLSLFAVSKSYATELASNFGNIYGNLVQVFALNVTKEDAVSGVQVDFQVRMRAVEWTGYFTVTYQPAGGAETTYDNIWFWPGAKLEVNNVSSLRLPVAYMRRFQNIPSGAGTWRMKVTYNGGGNTAGYIEAGSGFFVEEKRR